MATLRDIAKEHGVGIRDVIALAPANDPFAISTEGQIKAARWFADLWARFGYGSGIHLRRVHYQLISQSPPVELPDGVELQDESGQKTTIYTNTDNAWSYLGKAAKWARYLGYVDPSDFVDRRNPDAVLHNWHEAAMHTPGAAMETDEYFPELEDIGFPYLRNMAEAPMVLARGYRPGRGYLVEVWTEKTTQNDVLIPLTQGLEVNLIAGAGELSITAVVDFLDRVKKSGLPARILYISDFDPAGSGMPVSISRKIEYFVSQVEEFAGLDIKLYPIALSMEQVDQYNLPRSPVKSSDLRKDNWEAIHGRGAVELDALEALHPGVLGSIVREAVRRHHDHSWSNRAYDAQYEYQDALDRIVEEIKEETDLEDLMVSWSDLQDEHQGLEEEFNTLLEGFKERYLKLQDRIGVLNEKIKTEYGIIGDKIQERWEEVEAAAVELPAANVAEDDALYESSRDYWEQLLHYKAFRLGEEV